MPIQVRELGGWRMYSVHVVLGFWVLAALKLAMLELSQGGVQRHMEIHTYNMYGVAKHWRFLVGDV